MEDRNPLTSQNWGEGKTHSREGLFSIFVTLKIWLIFPPKKVAKFF
jgi:hypothetical protein